MPTTPAATPKAIPTPISNSSTLLARVADRSAPVDYPTFADGLRGMQLLEAVIESNKKRAWVKCGPGKK